MDEQLVRAFPPTRHSAVEAIRSAAQRLNVDPTRFARFLQRGRIAEILSALGREEAMAAHRAEMTALTQGYLEFLEEEMRLCREQLKAAGTRPSE